MFQYKRDIRRARMGMFSRKLNTNSVIILATRVLTSLEIVYSSDKFYIKLNNFKKNVGFYSS